MNMGAYNVGLINQSGRGVQTIAQNNLNMSMFFAKSFSKTRLFLDTIMSQSRELKMRSSNYLLSNHVGNGQQYTAFFPFISSQEKYKLPIVFSKVSICVYYTIDNQVISTYLESDSENRPKKN